MAAKWVWGVGNIRHLFSLHGSTSVIDYPRLKCKIRIIVICHILETVFQIKKILWNEKVSLALWQLMDVIKQFLNFKTQANALIGC